MSINESQRNQDDVADDFDLDLDLYFRVIQRHKKTVIRSVLITLSVALLYLFLATPQYYTNVLVKTNTGSSSAIGWDEVSELLSSGSDAVATAIEILSSRRVVEVAVREAHLDIFATPGYFPIIGAPIKRILDLIDDDPHDLRTPFPGLGKFAWGGEYIKVEQFNVPIFRTDVLTFFAKKAKFTLIKGRDQAFQVLDDDNNVLISGQVGEVSSGRLKLPNGQMEEISILVTQLIGREGTKFSVTRIPFELAVEGLQEELEPIEAAPVSGVIDLGWESENPELTARVLNTLVRTYKEKNITEKKARLDHMIDFMDAQIPVVTSGLREAEKVLSQYYEESGNIDIEQEAGLLLAQLVGIEGQISTLELQRVDYQAVYTSDHPLRVALELKLEKLRQQMADLNHKISLLPDSSIRAVNAERKVQIKADVYSLLLQRRQEFYIARAGLDSDFSTLDQAEVVWQVDNPQYLIIIALALFLGGFTGLMIVLFRKRNIEAVDTAEGLDRYGLPVMAIIQHSSPPSKFAWKDIIKRGRSTRQTTPDLEAANSIVGLRDLRASLLYSSIFQDHRTVLITAPLAGTGVAFISTNLMRQFAEIGKSVVLVDANIRNGHVHEMMSLAQSPGLAEIIQDGLGLDQALQRVESLPGQTSSRGSMAVLSAGRAVADPTQALMKEKFGQMIVALKQQFEVVIIATAPIVANTDAMPVIKTTEALNLQVIRAGRQVPDEIQYTINRINHWGQAVDGFVFNDATGSSV